MDKLHRRQMAGATFGVTRFSSQVGIGSRSHDLVSEFFRRLMISVTVAGLKHFSGDIWRVTMTDASADDDVRIQSTLPLNKRTK